MYTVVCVIYIPQKNRLFILSAMYKSDEDISV